MATVDKNFRVKNGLNVAGTATFNTDIVIGTTPISFDTNTGRLKIQIDGNWSPVAFVGDIPDPNETISFMDIGLAIDYDGEPSYIVQANGVTPSALSKFADGGSPASNAWSMYFDSGNI